MLAWRVTVWLGSPVHRKKSRYEACEICMSRGKDVELRETPVGIVCQDCWTLLPACDLCHTNPAILRFRGRWLCDHCLNPDMGEDDRSEILDEAARSGESNWLNEEALWEDRRER